MMYIKCPIGSNAFVKHEMQKKPNEFRTLVQNIVELAYPNEAFTLLQMCVTNCRITHFTQTLHPDQLNSLLGEFNRSVRTVFKLIGYKLNIRRWQIARLQSLK